MPPTPPSFPLDGQSPTHTVFFFGLIGTPRSLAGQWSADRDGCGTHEMWMSAGQSASIKRGFGVIRVAYVDKPEPSTAGVALAAAHQQACICAWSQLPGTA